MTRRRCASSGAALVETALIAPVFFLLVFGIIEMGFLLRDYQISSDAVTDAVRIGGLVGPDVGEDGTAPDYQILRTLRDSTGSLDPDWIERVVVFQAEGPSSGVGAAEQVPSACKDGTPIAGICNVYNDPYDAFLAVEFGDADYFDCDLTPTSPACDYPPADREDGPTVDDVENLGVWIRVQRPYFTGLIGSSVTLEQAAVARLEVGDLTG